VLLIQFICLQALDLATTLAFLSLGIGEGNPIVRAALSSPVPPAVSLSVVKGLALMLGLYAWRSGRRRLLRKMNLLYAVCLAWNVAAMIAEKYGG
jgi:hypothetical protein